MPPPRPCWPALSLMRLREVGYPPHLAGLASWEDWRDSCLYSELIPLVTERSSLIVKELLSRRKCQMMMPFSTETGLERVEIVGPVRWLWTLDSSAKTRNKEDRRGLARCLSDA